MFPLLQEQRRPEIDFIWQLLADFVTVCPIRRFAKYLQDTGGNHVQQYLLNATNSKQVLGHNELLKLLFGEPFLTESKDEAIKAASLGIIELFATFFKQGYVSVFHLEHSRNQNIRRCRLILEEIPADLPTVNFFSEVA